MESKDVEIDLGHQYYDLYDSVSGQMCIRDSPSSVETISNWGFQGWNSLKNLNIPESVKFIGDKAFSRCNIQTLVIPDNVTSIGKQAFNYCKSLETVVWSKGATTIDAQTFYECNKLREITIPNTVTVIQLSLIHI